MSSPTNSISKPPRPWCCIRGIRSWRLMRMCMLWCPAADSSLTGGIVAGSSADEGMCRSAMFMEHQQISLQKIKLLIRFVLTMTTHRRVCVLLTAAILTVGSRTVANVLRTAGDDTVDGHRGVKVFGKECHRDAVRSSHSYTTSRWGHKCVVLAVLSKVPWSTSPWALPVLVILHEPKKENEKSGYRHKTPVVLMRQMLAVLIRWFPSRKFVFSGDGGFATHELA